MINRFKSALLNAVSSSTVEERAASGSGSHNGTSSSHSKSSSGEASTALRPVKYEYSRPHFLNLLSHDEIQVSADHAVRPIIVPRDLSSLPWNVGYAETINSGKSKHNEDQARIHYGTLEFQVSFNASESSNEVLSVQTYKIGYKYFALFDGHAGPGAAVAAAAQLHTIIHEKLMCIAHHLIEPGPFCEVTTKSKSKGVMWFPNTQVTADSLIVGALESAFYEMDNLIEHDNKHFDGVNGGCTVVVCLFMLNKVFIANAGDSRAILCRRNSNAVALSNDFTPETERTRIRQLAAQIPELLAGEFTSNEYMRRPVKRDLGSKILYRAAHMTGWAYKTADVDDLKFPVVFGQGKRSRVLATIGVTRGFGDHELSAHSTAARIKPFLSSQPEVKVLDILEMDVGEDDVIVMGTDGLWDVTSNDVVASVVFSTVDQFPTGDPVRFKYRYTSAAQDLVMHARGKFTEKRNWRMNDGSAATIDDISVFVIPLWQYKCDIQENSVVQLEASDNFTSSTSETRSHNGIAPTTTTTTTSETHGNGPGVNGNSTINGLDTTAYTQGNFSDKENNNRQGAHPEREVSIPPVHLEALAPIPLLVNESASVLASAGTGNGNNLCEDEPNH